MHIHYSRLLLLAALLAGIPNPGLGTTRVFRFPENNRSDSGASASALFLVCDPSPPARDGTLNQDLNRLACGEPAADKQRDEVSPTPEFQLDEYGNAPEEDGTARPIGDAIDVQFQGDFASVLAQVNLVAEERVGLPPRRRRLTPGKIIVVIIVIFVLSSVLLLVAGIRSLPARRQRHRPSSTSGGTRPAVS